MIVCTATGKNGKLTVLGTELLEIFAKLMLRHSGGDIVFLTEDHLLRHIAVEVIYGSHTDLIEHLADIFLSVGYEFIAHYRVLKKD